MSEKDSTIENTSNEQEFFLTHANFQRLRQLQNEIFKTIELSPSIRKLVNLLITEKNLDALKTHFLEHFSK